MKTRQRRPKTYLNDSQKVEVVQLAKDSALTYNEIAESYNIALSHVSRIARQAGIIRKPGIKKQLPIQPIEAIQPVQAQPDLNIPLIERLQNTYDDLQEELHKWEAIKHEACHKIDALRKSRQEHHIALQALIRAKENNS